VEISHRSLVNFLLSMQCEPGLESTDVLLSVTTLSFDISGLELYLPLITGGRVVIAERQTAADPQLLQEKLDECGATVMQATPATWQMLLESGWSGRPDLTMLVGGESLPPSLADALLDRGKRLWNLYGPTETTVWSTVEPIQMPGERITIGRPIANTRAYILDQHCEPMPVGVPGELYLGGDGLGRGYRNQSELTAEKFVSDPFVEEPEARMYRTGDLARWLPDGRIEHLGRIDRQVKIRGFRIELGEIEAVLAEQASVAAAVVVAGPGGSGENRLVAYVVPASNGKSSGEERGTGTSLPPDFAASSGSGLGSSPLSSSVSVDRLRDALRRRLPDYMIPTATIWLDALPRMPNGKIDRKALPEPDPARPELGEAYVAPRTDNERLLADIFREVLDVDRVGIHDDFFAIGGHSMLAVRLFSRIEQTTGQRLPLTVLFECPTIAQMAELLDEGGVSQQAWSSLVPIRSEGSRPPLFCIHPAGGYTLYYRDLSRHLDPDQPVYALQAQGLGGEELPSDRLEEICSHYLREIRRVQPRGPYYLAGLCFGGVAAYEMARQLHAAGDEAALVALFDTYTPPYERQLRGRLSLRIARHRILERVDLEAGNLALLSNRERLAYLWEKVRRVAARMLDYPGMLALAVYDRLRDPLGRGLRRVRQANVRAMLAYQPRGYAGRLTLFRAAKQPAGNGFDPTLGWGGLADDGLEIHEVAGYHSTIAVEPQVKDLAAKLTSALDRARHGEARGDSHQEPLRTAQELAVGSRTS